MTARRVVLILGVMGDQEWRRGAACRDRDPSLFFSDDQAVIAKALRICAGCAVQAACLADALNTREENGIRGGRDLGADRRARETQAKRVYVIRKRAERWSA
jgi:WhiB family transcriptional regulator, redox-sensing transcriptional regulator